MVGKQTLAARKHLAWRNWRRAVALGAAYLVALAGVLAAFGAARVAAEAAAAPAGIVCHTTLPGEPAPAPDQGTSHSCLDTCCLGCLSLGVGLTPPGATISRPEGVAAAQLPLRTVDFAAPCTSKSHRSRAPPSAA